MEKCFDREPQLQRDASWARRVIVPPILRILTWLAAINLSVLIYDASESESLLTTECNSTYRGLVLTI